MAGRAPGRRRSALRDRAFAGFFFLAAAALFTWPFVRVPPLPVVPAFLYLLAAWALVVVGLWRVSRALRPGAGSAAEDDDGA